MLYSRIDLPQDTGIWMYSDALPPDAPRVLLATGKARGTSVPPMQSLR
jgi:hypothetical protein